MNENRDPRYDRVAHYVAGATWAMEPSALSMLLAILAERRSGNRPTDAEIRARIGDRRERRSDAAGQPAAGVAVIPISGPIVPRAGLMTEVSGATSINGLQASIRAALASPDVSAIVLDVDSPGGSVDLVPELAAEITAARGTKPIVAVANTMAASAAYWIASAADELVVSPSAEVGSIGVYSAHTDQSGAMAQAGVKTTLISAGKYKVEANPFEPLTPEAYAQIQAQVDAYYGMFTAAVAAQRGVTLDTVEASFGQGRMVRAADAVDRGMADRVGTIDETIRRLSDLENATNGSVVIVGRRATPPADAPELVRRLLSFDREVRTMRRPSYPIEVRDRADGAVDVIGYAALFGDVYDVHDARYGDYEEEVLPGAFTKTLRDADVRYLLNHEDLPLARTKSGTLVLEQTDLGLYYEALSLDTSDPDVQRLLPKLRRGDLAESSFGFRAIRQIWDRDYSHRQLAEVELFDVSTVTWAASTSTSSSVRAADLIRDLAVADPAELLSAVRSAGADHGLHDAALQALALLQDVLEEPDAAAARDTPPTINGYEAIRRAELLRLRARV